MVPVRSTCGSGNHVSMSLIDYTRERIETYTEEFDMGAPTKKLKKEETEAKQPLEERAAARGLEGAYDDDEPEYTLEANDR